MARKIEEEIQLSRPLDSLPRELTLNIFRSELFLMAALEEALRPAGLQLDEYNVLRIVRGAGAEGHSRAEIEGRMVHEADRLLAILHRLKTRGLIEGAQRLRITAAGEEVVLATDPDFMRKIEETVGWIPSHRLRAAIEVLESIRVGPPRAEES